MEAELEGKNIYIKKGQSTHLEFTSLHTNKPCLKKVTDSTHSCAFQVTVNMRINLLSEADQQSGTYVAHETNQLSMVGWPVCSILLIMSIPNAESEELNKASQY